MKIFLEILSVNLPLNGHFYQIWPYGRILNGTVYWCTHFFGQGTLNECTLRFHRSLKMSCAVKIGTLPNLKWEHFGIFCSKFNKIAILKEFWVRYHFDLGYFYHFYTILGLFLAKIVIFHEKSNFMKICHFTKNISPPP